ncbi:hypothetical protein D3C81_1953910 [compost metagenome]
MLDRLHLGNGIRHRYQFRRSAATGNHDVLHLGTRLQIDDHLLHIQVFIFECDIQFIQHYQADGRIT